MEATVDSANCGNMTGDAGDPAVHKRESISPFSAARCKTPPSSPMLMDLRYIILRQNKGPKRSIIKMELP